MNLTNAHSVAAILPLECASFRIHPFKGKSVRQHGRNPWSTRSKLDVNFTKSQVDPSRLNTDRKDAGLYGFFFT